MGHELGRTGRGVTNSIRWLSSTWWLGKELVQVQVQVGAQWGSGVPSWRPWLARWLRALPHRTHRCSAMSALYIHTRIPYTLGHDPSPRARAQNMLMLRFANPIFGAFFNRHYISNIQVTFKVG